MRISTLLLAFALVSLAALPARAQTCTTQWTGTVGSDFAEPANWSNGVPLSGAVGCIDGDGTSVVDHSPHAMPVTYGIVVVGGESGDHTLRIDVPGEILFEQLLIRPTGTFIAEDGAFPGNIENDGLIQLPASDGVVLAEGTMNEGSTIVNRGRIEVTAGPTALLLEGTLINETEGTVAMIATGDPVWLTSNDNYQFINRGLITSTGSDVGPSEGNQVGHVEALSPGFINEGGRIEVLDGELIVSGSGGTRFESGEVVAGEDAVLRVAGGNPAELDGTLTGTSAGEIVFQLGTAQTLGDEVTFDVGGNGLGFASPAVSGGTWRNVGTITLSAALDGTSFTNEGTARWVTLSMNNSSFANEIGATIDVVSDGNFSGTAPGVVNRGLLVKQAGTGTSSLAFPVANETGGEIRAASGLLSFTALSDAEGSTISGTAQLGAPGTFEPMGTIAPGIGEAPGTLTWRFSQTLQPTTTLELDLNGPTPGAEYDQLVGFTAVNFILDGTLRVRVADDYNPPVGTEFVVMQANSISGDFATVDLPQGLDYEVNADNVILRVVSPIPAEDGPTQPAAFALGAAYPNPFRTATEFTVEMPESGRATVEAFDVLGRRVAVLHDDDLGTGTHTLRFDAADLPAGLYMLRATSGATVQTRRVTLLR